MKQVNGTITINELSEMAKKMYGAFVKCVVDINKRLLVVDAEMHVDEEQLLLENGSRQQDLWGINIYPSNYSQDDFIEYDSMINIRPSANNMFRSVEDADIQDMIVKIVDSKVKND